MTVSDMQALAERSHKAQYHAHHPWSELQAADGVVVARGEGVYVFDVDGRRYLDAIAGGWNVALGFSAEPLVEAAISQLRTLPYYHTLYNRTTEAAVTLSEQLRAIAPFEAGRIVYSNSGSEAVETAVKLAWLYHAANGQPQRRKLLARRGSVHGSTIFTACLGGLGLGAVFGPENQLVRHLTSPNHALYAEPGESEADFYDRLIDELRAAIDEEGSETIAAMVIEPVPVVEGFHAPNLAYLRALNTVLDEHGILLICDEVVTGLGRTGSLFACSQFDCRPDLLVLGKSLTSGYAALAATVPSARVGEAVDRMCTTLGEFPHALTTGMHPVAMRVASAVLTALSDGGVLAHVNDIAPYFQEALRSMLDLSPVARVDGLGLGGSIHLQPGANAAGGDAAFEVARRCRAEGVLVHGQHGSIIVAPPLIIERSEIDLLFGAIRRAVNELA